MLYINDNDLARASKQKSIVGFVFVTVRAHFKNRRKDREVEAVNRVARLYRY